MEKVLIIDDDAALCEVLKRMLESRGLAAACCGTGPAGLRVLAEAEYQLVVLDVMLPGMDGFAVLEKIRALCGVPVLMLTARADSESELRGLQTGADDYLTKPFYMEEFLARVLALIRRYTRFNRPEEPRLEFPGLVILPDSKTVLRDGGAVALLPKEYEILLYCARNRGRILTKKQLYEAVWEAPYVYNAGIDNNLMAIISRLRKKIEPDAEKPRYLQTVKGMGYRFDG